MHNTLVEEAKFPSGRVLMTRGIEAKFADDMELIHESLGRHFTGDWGDLCEQDAKMNNDALERGDARIMSVYELDPAKIYIITEWDRSATTVLLPFEY